MREMYLTDFHTVTITAIVQKQGGRQNYILSLGMLDIEFPKKKSKVKLTRGNFHCAHLVIQRVPEDRKSQQLQSAIYILTDNK